MLIKSILKSKELLKSELALINTYLGLDPKWDALQQDQEVAGMRPHLETFSRRISNENARHLIIFSFEICSIISKTPYVIGWGPGKKQKFGFCSPLVSYLANKNLITSEQQRWSKPANISHNSILLCMF